MASVRQLTTPNREGKRPWIVEYTDPSGKRRRATPKSGLKKDADKLRQKIEREIADGAHTVRSETVTLKDAVEAWLLDCERRHRIGDTMAGATLAGYRSKAENHVIPTLGHRLISELTAIELQDFIDKKATTLAFKSCKTIRTILSHSLRLAVRRKFLRRHPMVDDPVKVPGSARRKEIVIPSKAELSALLKAMSEPRPFEQSHARAGRIVIVSLGLFAGLRRGEICGLQWENVDFDGRVINLRYSVSRQDGLKEPKTKAGKRTIPLSPILADVLHRYATETACDRKGQLLRTRVGTRPLLDNLGGRDWFILMKAAGLLTAAEKPKYSLHTMRHAFISLLIEQGVQPIVIKAIAGHARISTTMDTYGHLFPENSESRRGILAMGQQFAAAATIAEPVAQIECHSREDWLDAKEKALELVTAGVAVKEVARRFSTSSTLIYKWQRDAQRDKCQLQTRQERDILA